MQRADRGIEQVDLNTLNVRLGGLGGNPKDLGIKVSKTLFAPRLGAVYRFNDNTVFRDGLRHHLQPAAVLAAAARLLPADDLGQLLRRPIRTGAITTLEQGIPDIAGPDLSSGNIPLPNSYDMRTPADDVSRGRIQSWNVVVRAPAHVRHLGGRGVRRHALDGRLRRPRRQRVDDARLRRRLPAVLRQTFGRSIAAEPLGAADAGRTTTRCRWPSTGRSRTG